MELYFIAVVVVIVIVLSLALALASNKAEESKQPTRGRKQGNQRAERAVKDKTAKANPRKRGAKKQVVDVKFGSDGKVENEDDSMVELIQGTLKHAAKEAKEEAKKKLQSVAKEAEIKGKQNTKTSKKKQSTTAADGEEDNSEYVLIKSRKTKTDKEVSTTPAANDSQVSKAAKGKKSKKSDAVQTGEGSTQVSTSTSTPAAVDGTESNVAPRRKKAFLKSEVPPPRQPGDKTDKRPPRERRQRNPEDATNESLNSTQDSSNNGGDRPRRVRPPRALNQDGTENVDPNASPLPQRPPRKPKVVETPLPVPLSAGPSDVPNLDDMMWVGALDSFYGKPKPSRASKKEKHSSSTQQVASTSDASDVTDATTHDDSSKILDI